MFTVERVEIDGLWGQLSLETDLKQDVNIFIGDNGSGKTTFISILQAILTVDLELLSTLNFNEARLVLRSPREHRRISVQKKTSDIPYDIVIYKIGSEVTELPMVTREADDRRIRMQTKLGDELAKVRDKISKLVKVSWLSVHREILESEYRDYREYNEYRSIRERRHTVPRNPVDRRLQDLMIRLTAYQLELQAQSNKASTDFEKQVLASMLYDPKFDTWEYLSMRVNLQKIRRGLLKAYKDLGVLDVDSDIENRIDDHVEKLRSAIKAVKAHGQEKEMKIDDVLPLPLLMRTHHIVQMLTNVDNKKKTLNKPLKLYLETLRGFADDKEFELDPSKAGQLMVKKGTTDLPIDQLSSGEKQLVILLTETLLQENERFVFIADEPELSLHIKWQRRILSSIRTLNAKAQIIVATHSPEIAAKWPQNIIKMGDIIHG